MSSYVLYLPGKQGANPQHLADVGLGDLAKDQSPEFADCFDGGPDGARGLLAAWRTGDATRDPPFDVRKFTWQPAKADAVRGLAAARFYFGVVTGDKVAPAGIARREGIAGYPITLADGQVWRVPKIVNLPKVFGLDADGKFEVRVNDRYAGVARLADQYCYAFFKAANDIQTIQSARPDTTAEPVQFTLEDAWSYAADVLAINYRVTREIADILNLFDSESLVNVIKASIDLAAIIYGKPAADIPTITIG